LGCITTYRTFPVFTCTDKLLKALLCKSLST
jgi:hypothetical protein